MPEPRGGTLRGKGETGLIKIPGLFAEELFFPVSTTKAIDVSCPDLPVYFWLHPALPLSMSKRGVKRATGLTAAHLVIYRYIKPAQAHLLIYRYIKLAQKSPSEEGR
jgi:hypothetical protein